MKFFIDTANIEQIRQAQNMGILDGVTTNPSLMAKEGVKGKEEIFEHYRTICGIVDGPVSAEVFSTDYEGMIREGEELAAIDPKITVKLPCTKDGIRAVKYFSSKGIATNCTLVFSVGQALLAAKAGATFVSPFIGRLDDISEDGVALVEHIVKVYRTYGFKTQVLAASIKGHDDGLTEIEIIHDGIEKDVYFNGKDEWVRTEYETTYNNLPEAVKNYISANYTSHENEADAVETPAGNWFEIEARKGGTEYDVLINEDGTLKAEYKD